MSYPILSHGELFVKANTPQTIQFTSKTCFFVFPTLKIGGGVPTSLLKPTPYPYTLVDTLLPICQASTASSLLHTLCAAQGLQGALSCVRARVGCNAAQYHSFCMQVVPTTTYHLPSHLHHLLHSTTLHGIVPVPKIASGACTCTRLDFPLPAGTPSVPLHRTPLYTTERWEGSACGCHEHLTPITTKRCPTTRRYNTIWGTRCRLQQPMSWVYCPQVITTCCVDHVTVHSSATLRWQ